MKKGFILDLDGVICDTAKFHFEAWKRLAAEYHYNLTEADNEALKGVSRADSLKFILKQANHTLSPDQFELDLVRKNEWYLSLVEQMDQSYLLDGVLDFFAKAKEINMPLALGSASKNAKLVLEKVGLLYHFDAIVDANLVTNGKPHPETFLKAAELINVPPNQCIVFEDSASGVQAAISGNMYAVGIGNASDLPQAHICIPNLGKFDFTTLTL
jgi:beta-phosphoglucomutase